MEALRTLKRKSLNFGKSNVAKYLGSDTKVTKVDLTEKKIGDDGLIQLLQLLQQRKDVKELELFGNDITDDGITTLTEILKQNYKINTVKLQFNNITARGAGYLADFLKINDSIVRLDLYGNKIEDEGCMQIARALGRNQNLTSLSLVGCKITNKGATHLVKYLEGNKVMKVLNVDNNDIDDDLVEAVNAYCARNNGEDDWEIPAGVANFMKKYDTEETNGTPNSRPQSMKGIAPIQTPTVTKRESATEISSAPANQSSAPNYEQMKPIAKKESTPQMPAISNSVSEMYIDEMMTKSKNDGEWGKERTELLQKMRELVKDKESLSQYISKLTQEIEKLKRQNNHLEQFVYSLKRNFAILEREHPILEAP